MEELEAPPDGHLARAEEALGKLEAELGAEAEAAEAELAAAMEEATQAEAAKVTASGKKRGRPAASPGGRKWRRHGQNAPAWPPWQSGAGATPGLGWRR